VASGDVLPFPVRGYQYRLTIPIYDADGDLVTAAAALDSEVSIDAGTFADCTNEATEIATSSGVYYLDLTATEMTAVSIAGITKTTTTGAKTTPWFISPRVLPNVITGTATAGALGSLTLAASASTLLDRYTGKLLGITGGTGSGQVRVITAYSAGRVATVVPNWSGVLDNTSIYAVLEPNSINSHMEAEAGPTAVEIGNDVAARTLNSNVVSMAAATVTAAAIATDAVDADALAADALTEIFTKVWTTALTEAYAADGVAPTGAQAIFLIQQMLTEMGIVTTTLTVKKLDGTTTAATFTLNSATAPTSLTRVT